MNAIVTTAERQPRSVLVDMSTRFGMEPAAFEATVRATCSPAPKKGEEFRPLTREEFAAFLLVAREYKLNPLTREIYAYPKRGGGVVPIVSIDGWVNLVNSHPACDGFEFDIEHGDKGALISISCRMYRKDRSRPVAVTEYLSECYRETDPWKMKHRMLRHKALIQAARYAFGFSGIYDEDEGTKIAEMRDVTPMARPQPPVPPSQQIAAPIEHVDPATGEVTDAVAEGIDADTADVIDDGMVDDTAFFERLEEALAVVPDLATVEEVWTSFDPLARFEGQHNGEINQGIAIAIRKNAEKRIGAK